MSAQNPSGTAPPPGPVPSMSALLASTAAANAVSTPPPAPAAQPPADQKTPDRDAA